jgi:hypothetical protein
VLVIRLVEAFDNTGVYVMYDFRRSGVAAEICISKLNNAGGATYKTVSYTPAYGTIKNLNFIQLTNGNIVVAASFYSTTSMIIIRYTATLV